MMEAQALRGAVMNRCAEQMRAVRAHRQLSPQK